MLFPEPEPLQNADFPAAVPVLDPDELLEGLTDDQRAAVSHVDGPLLVDDEGLHGMAEKCSTTELTRGSHVIYIEGFQAGGGPGRAWRRGGGKRRCRR